MPASVLHSCIALEVGSMEMDPLMGFMRQVCAAGTKARHPSCITPARLATATFSFSTMVGCEEEAGHSPHRSFGTGVVLSLWLCSHKCLVDPKHRQGHFIDTLL